MNLVGAVGTTGSEMVEVEYAKRYGELCVIVNLDGKAPRLGKCGGCWLA